MNIQGAAITGRINKINVVFKLLMNYIKHSTDPHHMLYQSKIKQNINS